MLLFQELLELAQRKFLRQVAGYTSGDGGGFPRIILIDYWTDEEIRQQEKAGERMIKMQIQKEKQKDDKELGKKNVNECDEENKENAVCNESEKSAGKEPDVKEEKKTEETTQKASGDSDAEKKENCDVHFENLDNYDGPGSEFCVRLMCEYEQVKHYQPNLKL